MRTGVLLILTVLALAFCVNATVLSEREYQSHFSTFVKKFEKRYQHEEFFAKFNIFKQNLDIINEHNAKANKSYTLAVNEFADMSFEEFHSKMTGYKHKQANFARSLNTPKGLDKIVPAPSIDWRTKNAVTPIKNQGQCGSCWAFSTTGSTEGANAIKSGNLISFSEQELVDCSTSYGNEGCNGGLMDQAFEYIIAKGICSESSYPYTAMDGRCKTTCQSVGSLSSYQDIKAGDEASLLPALNINPVSIAIEADQQAFQFYSGGVFNARCGTNLDHGVLLVGYGTTGSQDYYIMKNSWGTTWGEQGYMRMIRGQNECGLSNAASYPIV